MKCKECPHEEHDFGCPGAGCGCMVMLNCPACDRPMKGVTLVTIVHDDNGDPSPIVMTGIQPGETIRVDMVGGKVSVDTKNKPTVINADTGEEITHGASSSLDAP